METVTISKTEYLQLQQTSQMFNLLKTDVIRPAKRKGKYTELFGLWADMTISVDKYRKQLWERKDIF